MSPFAGSVLLSAVIPLIVAGIRRGAKPVGTEDYNELVQDASAVAAAMIDSAERREEPIIPKICQLKRQVRRNIRDAWGMDATEILTQSGRSPAWRVAMANA